MIRLSCQRCRGAEKTGPRAAVIVRIKGSSGFCSEVIASITSKSFSKQLRAIYTHYSWPLKQCTGQLTVDSLFPEFLCIHGFNQPHTVVFTVEKYPKKVNPHKFTPVYFKAQPYIQSMCKALGTTHTHMHKFAALQVLKLIYLLCRIPTTKLADWFWNGPSLGETPSPEMEHSWH